VVTAVGGVVAGQVGVVLGLHIAATAPCLIADPPELDRPRLFAAVPLAHPHHWAVTGPCQVFDPLAHFLNGAWA
jgi:hypothetical protein